MPTSNIEVIEELRSEPIGIFQKVYLKNGVILYVTNQGYAEGNNGKNYYPVLKEIFIMEDGRSIDTTIILGWSCNINHEIVICN